MKSKENQLVIGRRSALKMLGLGSAGMLAGGFTDIKASEPADMGPKPKQLVTSGNSSVAFTTGTDRQNMLFEVVKPFESEIKKGLKGKQLIIKPNMVVTNTALCATHVDALRGLLEYLKPIYKGQVIIAESSSQVDSAAGFKEYGYLDLAKDYNVKFIDLNTTNGKPFYVLDRNLHLDKIFVSELFLDPANYFISISRLKTHNTVVMTGGVKNMMMAAPLNLPAANGEQRGINYKRNMHSGGPRWLHYNMYLMAQAVRPDFTIIDGVEGMEGNGPIAGTPVNHKIALAGQDVVAVDSMCSRLMGIPLENVGYLNYCEAGGLGNVDRNKIDIIGSAKPEDNVITYKLSSNSAYQLEWKDPLNLPSQQQGPRPQQGQAPAQPQRN
ncbi:MAG: DUF362 domain-containing protein [Bacteroidales bacterium]|jgi:uncharacterized protein (DUF362 family)|nr:DUF362 domain-containing protein [Bacteroidales bacterium]